MTIKAITLQPPYKAELTIIEREAARRKIKSHTNMLAIIIQEWAFDRMLEKHENGGCPSMDRSKIVDPG